MTRDWEGAGSSAVSRASSTIAVTSAATLTLGVGRAGVVMTGSERGIRADDEQGGGSVNEFQSPGGEVGLVGDAGDYDQGGQAVILQGPQGRVAQAGRAQHAYCRGRAGE